MYKCNKCNKSINIKLDNSNLITINGKDYLTDDKFICEKCKGELKNVKWTEHIGNHLIKECSIELNDKFGTIAKIKQ